VKKPTPFGKYSLFDRVAVGGMAEVYRAKTLGLEGAERIVAIKKMLDVLAADKELVSMFIDEAKLAVQLNHPSICQVTDWGKVDDSYYIAMEYIAGRDVRALFRRCKEQVPDGAPTMPMAQSCHLVMKLCEALDYAHNKKDSLGNDLHIVHRDVSPGNVLVSFEGEVKLIDFGVAKAQAAREQHTEAGELKGKFSYMSPEQVRGEALDRRADIFSAGIVLYELLTGERLFPADNELMVLDKIKNVEVLPPTAYNRKIPEELERIVMKALAPRREDRYQTAMDMHDDLQSFMYTSGEFYSRKELAVWMKRVFRAEYDQEQAELDAVREARVQPQAAAAGADGLQRARQTLSMTALRTGGASPKETGALTRPKETGTLRALGSEGQAPPSSWTPSGGQKRKGSTPPPTPRGTTQSIAQAAAQMIADGEKTRPNPAPVPAIRPSSAPTGRSGVPQSLSARAAQPVQEIHIDDDTAVDGPAAAGKIRWDGSNPSVPPQDADVGEGETQLYQRQRSSSPAMAKAMAAPPARMEEDADSDLGTLMEGGPTLANPPGTRPPIHEPVAPPTLAMPPRSSAPSLPAVPSYPVSGRPGESFGSRAQSAVLPPPQLVVPPPIDLGPTTPPPQPVRRSAVPVLLLLLFLLVAGGGAGYWFFLRPADLVVAAEPGRELTVFVDQQRVAVTDSPVMLKLPPGMHTVQVQHAGYRPWSETLSVRPGETLGRSARLEPLAPQTGGFTLVSDPPGAQAFLDGVALGQVTPMRVQSVVAGPHTIELRLGTRAHSQQITVEAGKLIEVTVALPQPAAPPAPAGTAPDKPAGATPTEPVPPTQPTQPTGTEAPGKPAVAATEPAQPAADKPGRRPQPVPRPRPAVRTPPVAPSGNFGYLRINSKPWSKIIVDGSDTGLNTPQTSYRLSVGQHRITLSNPQFGINDSFTVVVAPGETKTVIKDYQK
jgi:tRNA A-37 threonylcarbamoyl transferase component Bud32